MELVTNNETPNQVRARILEASQGRFRQYGYNKTTMAEVAKDCGMSAANLYRYFENKHRTSACSLPIAVFEKSWPR